MPFEEIYAVNFAEGNLKPHLDADGWGDMRLNPASAVREADAWGYRFEITRPDTLDNDAPRVLNSVYVAPTPGSLPIASRIILHATFDQPMAKGYDSKGNLHPIPSFGAGPTHGPLGDEFEEPNVSQVTEPAPGEPALPASQLTKPEDWAVALNIGADENFGEDTSIIVTCQFFRQLSPVTGLLISTGVRLNTPFSLQSNTSPAAPLASPLDYKSYQGGLLAPHDDRWVEPPLFSLSHSFCGFEANNIGHTPGCGFLKLARIFPPELQDHRVYSSDILINPGGNAITSIGALGITIGTRSGEGRMSARLRTFSVSTNEPLRLS